LLCENKNRLFKSVKLVSAGFTEGFYGKPRVDEELLRRYSEGLICLSACLAGEIPKKLLEGITTVPSLPLSAIMTYMAKTVFYLEVQDHGIPEQDKVNRGILRIHRETGIPLVATNDAHYIKRMMRASRMCFSAFKPERP
jgi:DNA polymerase-3 subunit alpha